MFHFMVVKFSIYLNRHVFVMPSTKEFGIKVFPIIVDPFQKRFDRLGITLSPFDKWGEKVSLSKSLIIVAIIYKLAK